MTRPDLDAIRARCDAATPGPWGFSRYEKRYLLDETTDVVGEVAPGSTGASITVFAVATGALEDADFIARARTDIPALIARVRELETECDALRALLVDAHRELATIEAITVSPSGVDGLIELVNRIGQKLESSK